MREVSTDRGADQTRLFSDSLGHHGRTHRKTWKIPIAQGVLSAIDIRRGIYYDMGSFTASQTTRSPCSKTGWGRAILDLMTSR